MAKDYVKSETAKLVYADSSGAQRTMQLLWGDEVDVQGTIDGKTTVKARGRLGVVDAAHLGGSPLLEVYFIDVGQGDGVLICTPERKHVLIDGGWMRTRQPTGKNAADFVDWKFHDDYGLERIHLDAMIASHCDADHYGGLWDLFNTSEEARKELDTVGTDVDVLYHAGVSWWKGDSGRWLGATKAIEGETYLVQLLGDRAQVIDALDPAAPGPKLQGEWAQFLTAAIENGCDIRRLSHVDGYVPGFEPVDDEERATLKIIAPVEYDDDTGAPALRAYDDPKKRPDKNTNGHSLLLRLDYKGARILLTGDLNKRSMASILEDIEDVTDLACDVAKGCHHGSDDVSYTFLQGMRAAATIISSGDNEGHAHPRPTIVAASATTGFVTIEDDEMLTPLVYSTEISRSIDVGRLVKVTDGRYQHHTGDIEVELRPSDNAWMHYEVQKAGDLHPAKVKRYFRAGTRVVDRVTYGLVNVRTDGDKILCATLNEKKDQWEIATFESRF